MWPGAAQARASPSKYPHVGAFGGAHPISIFEKITWDYHRGTGVVALNKRQPCEHPLLNLLTLKDLSPWELEDGNYRVMLTTSRVEGVHHGTVF